MSQNEYIEQALRNDLVIRGQLRAEQLRQVADRLTTITDDAYAELVERSIDEFAQGEAEPDPAAMQALTTTQGVPRETRRTRTSGITGAVAAFRTGR